MKFKLLLPTTDVNFLNIQDTINFQILDANTIGSNDHISACSYSLKELCDEAYENESVVKKIVDKDEKFYIPTILNG